MNWTARRRPGAAIESSLADAIVSGPLDEGNQSMSQRSEHREFLLGAVEAVRDTVSVGVAEGEATGTLPKATVEALTSSGLTRSRHQRPSADSRLTRSHSSRSSSPSLELMDRRDGA